MKVFVEYLLTIEGARVPYIIQRRNSGGRMGKKKKKKKKKKEVPNFQFPLSLFFSIPSFFKLLFFPPFDFRNSLFQ